MKILTITVTLLVLQTTNVSSANGEERPYVPLSSFAMCSYIPSFLRKNTNLKCSNNRLEMEIWYNGTKEATKECKYHFAMRPWNCSSSAQSLPRIVSHAFPETAYLYAIHSAGLAYSLATACASGREDCKCKTHEENQYVRKITHSDTTIVLKDKACTKDSLEYGIKKSRELLKNIKERDIRWQVDEHNKEAGRLALIDADVNKRNKLCSCHGVSGTCQINTCTLRLPRYRDVSTFLMEKYKSAVRVGSDNYGRKLIPSEKNMKEPTKNDLLYMENSPEFCEKNLKQGSLGTTGRTCIKGSSGPDGCGVLCCNRGFKTIVEKEEMKCKCMFKFCCEVSCQDCTKTRITHVCK